MANIIKEILRAQVYQVAHETPLEAAQILSARYQNQVWIKREDLQPTHSFKLRGAFNKLFHLSKAKQIQGVITVSAGNHAQGVALSAQKLGIKATIVMPATTPEIKVNAVRSYGAKVILHGDNYDAASAHASALAVKRQLTMIHPFDDVAVIAGQGTVAVEILRQASGFIDAIFVPIGGGGLIGGIAAYVKYISPKTKVIGVEPEDAASMSAALEAQKRVILSEIGIFADGVAVKQVGKKTYDLVNEYVDDVITVSVDEICAAMKDIFEDNRSVAEPAGAVGLAGLKKYAAKKKWQDKTLVTIESGANMNFDRLRHVAERADIGEKKELVFAAKIDEKPGSFLKFCRLLGKRQITEFNYRYAGSKTAHIFVGIERDFKKKDTSKSILKKLHSSAIGVVNLSDNEMAKQHVRYMVGGRLPDLDKGMIDNEVLYRFEFPERPGALLDFLSNIGSKWNISLFHYRNHGAAYGRALVGVQIPAQEVPVLEQFFDGLGFAYQKEQDNPAYTLFLS